MHPGSTVLRRLTSRVQDHVAGTHVLMVGIISASWQMLRGRACFSMNPEDEAVFEYALRGKDWNVYWLLLKNGGSMSVREVQRALRFSSPSVAQHHLEQLRQLGLVKKEEIGGSYSLTSEVKIGVLRHFVKLGRLLFPRYFFYALFSTTFYLIYVFALMQGLTRENVFILVFGAIVSAIFWFEASRIWSLRPY
jgi:predicted DNA-binding transcriptional regulator